MNAVYATADKLIYQDICQPAVSNQIIWLFLSCNVATDLYVLSIPIPMLWSANMRLFKKLGLMVLFSGGLVVIACAILRVVLLVAVRNDPMNISIETTVLNQSPGSDQWRTVSGLVRCTGDVRGSSHDEPPNDLPLGQGLAESYYGHASLIHEIYR